MGIFGGHGGSFQPIWSTSSLEFLLGGYPGAGQQAMTKEQMARMGGFAAQQHQPYSPSFFSQRIVKRVNSREVTPRERARKQINGAVQAVKDAQNKAKTNG